MIMDIVDRLKNLRNELMVPPAPTKESITCDDAMKEITSLRQQLAKPAVEPSDDKRLLDALNELVLASDIEIYEREPRIGSLFTIDMVGNKYEGETLRKAIENAIAAYDALQDK
jgi:hypothetical protein